MRPSSTLLLFFTQRLRRCRRLKKKKGSKSHGVAGVVALLEPKLVCTHVEMLRLVLLDQLGETDTSPSRVLR
jgi:hypothetical protein